MVHIDSNEMAFYSNLHEFPTVTVSLPRAFAQTFFRRQKTTVEMRRVPDDLQTLGGDGQLSWLLYKTTVAGRYARIAGVLAETICQPIFEPILNETHQMKAAIQSTNLFERPPFSGWDEIAASLDYLSTVFGPVATVHYTLKAYKLKIKSDRNRSVYGVYFDIFFSYVDIFHGPIIPRHSLLYDRSFSEWLKDFYDGVTVIYDDNRIDFESFEIVGDRASKPFCERLWPLYWTDTRESLLPQASQNEAFAQFVASGAAYEAREWLRGRTVRSLRIAFSFGIIFEAVNTVNYCDEKRYDSFVAVCLHVLDVKSMENAKKRKTTQDDGLPTEKAPKRRLTERPKYI